MSTAAAAAGCQSHDAPLSVGARTYAARDQWCSCVGQSVAGRSSGRRGETATSLGADRPPAATAALRCSPTHHSRSGTSAPPASTAAAHTTSERTRRRHKSSSEPSPTHSSRRRTSLVPPLRVHAAADYHLFPSAPRSVGRSPPSLHIAASQSTAHQQTLPSESVRRHSSRRCVEWLRRRVPILRSRRIDLHFRDVAVGLTLSVPCTL